MHFKYIKRERKNGKWVYYYDKAAADKELNYHKNRSHNAWIDALTKAGEKHEAIKKRDAIWEADASGYRMANAGVSLATAAYNDAEKKYQKLLKKYERVKTKTFAHRTISRGIIAVANFLSGSTRRKKKTK